MIRWMTLKNLMLEDAGTQCFDKMWYWDMGFYINCMKFWTTLFWAEIILLFIWTSSILMLEKWMWACYHFEMLLFKCVLKLLINFTFLFLLLLVHICMGVEGVTSFTFSFLFSVREFSLSPSSSWNFLFLPQVISPSMFSPPKPKSSSLDSPLSFPSS